MVTPDRLVQLIESADVRSVPILGGVPAPFPAAPEPSSDQRTATHHVISPHPVAAAPLKPAKARNVAAQARGRYRMGEETLDDRARRELDEENRIHEANLKRMQSGSRELRDEYTRHSDRIVEITKESIRRRRRTRT